MDVRDDDVPLLDVVLDRLASDEQLAEEVSELVLAAVLGDEDLTTRLGGESVASPVRHPDGSAEAPPAMYLAGIRVEGFRGVAGAAELPLAPGPGLTLVVGRNGSGKSSFAEAAELALTGTSLRWAKRTKVWQQGWANLHHDGQRSVEVRLDLDGVEGQTVVRRRWNPGDALEDGAVSVQRHRSRQAPLSDGLGRAIDEALNTFRPFLSYNELGALLEEGPSKLHDALSKVLGLDLLVAAEHRLNVAYKSLDEKVKEADTEANRLIEKVAKVDDPRAIECERALHRRNYRRASWDVSTVESIVSGGAGPAGDEMRALEQFKVLQGPDPAAIAGVVNGLRGAAERLDTLAGTDAERARRRADLLDRALASHEHEGGQSCPVCGTADVLDETWRQTASAEVAQLREEAATAEEAERAATEARRKTLGLTAAEMPSALAVTDAVDGVDSTPVRIAWEEWRAVPSSGDGDLRVMADHLEERGHAVASSLALLRKEATVELDRRRDVWLPVSMQLAAWLPLGREAQRAAPQATQVKTAKEWVRKLAGQLRRERFVPISEQVRGLWEKLRQTSNVSIDDVQLTGQGPQRRVQLSVAVDETKGAALAVMSQGELHAMALSLFLPRATLAQSPFRFIVIDDPVQAMDGARVDGLARVLAEVAQTHQVIVLTHDERLRESVRRLTIPASVLKVTRTQRSNVAVRPQAHPIDHHLEDARWVLGSDQYPQQPRRRVIPGLCRQAIEAACIDVTRRRRLTAGHPHDDVEELIRSNPKLIDLLALALFDDEERGGEVLRTVNDRYGRAAGDTVTAVNKGSHQLIDDHPGVLVERTEQLARQIVKLP